MPQTYGLLLLLVFSGLLGIPINLVTAWGSNSCTHFSKLSTYYYSTLIFGDQFQRAYQAFLPLPKFATPVPDLFYFYQKKTKEPIDKKVKNVCNKKIYISYKTRLICNNF
jgi:hypothetical protein